MRGDCEPSDRATADAIRHTESLLLRAKYPELQVSTKRRSVHSLAAINVGIELATAFPSIRSFTINMPKPDTIAIAWRDGPSESQLIALAKKYQLGCPDDLNYTGRVSTTWHETFGYVIHIRTERSYSPVLLAGTPRSMLDHESFCEPVRVFDPRVGHLTMMPPSEACH